MPTSSERDNHLFGPGPKRALALDGGGTMGVVELAFLARIEALLRDRFGGDPAFRLCDYFDLIGGTSAGAIIAAGLATGMSVAEITQQYLQLAPLAFRRRRWRVTGLLPRYDAGPLARSLHAQFGEHALDSDIIRTGLAIVARRFDTGSPWIISNSPRAPYWADPEDRSFIGNRHYRLAEVVRASTALPGFFRPQWLQIVAGQRPGMFIDGAISPYNNPSLAVLIVAQARAFGLRWALAPEHFLLISIGTGQYRRGLAEGAPPPRLPGTLAVKALMDQVADGQVLTLTLLQWVSEPAFSWPISSEIGDLSGELLGGRPLLAFQRYDVRLEQDWLRDRVRHVPSAHELMKLRAFDYPGGMARLHALAAEVAEQQVQPEHFAPAFDLPAAAAAP